MARGAGAQAKKRRSVLIIDADRARIHEAARAEGLPHGDYLVRAHRFRQTATDAAGTAIPPQMLRRMMRMLRIVEQAERLRLEAVDDGRVWRKLGADADAWLDDRTAFFD